MEKKMSGAMVTKKYMEADGETWHKPGDGPRKDRVKEFNDQWKVLSDEEKAEYGELSAAALNDLNKRKGIDETVVLK